MKKILIIPLDERPCNYEFSNQIFERENLIVDRIPFEYMGSKKKKEISIKLNNTY